MRFSTAAVAAAGLTAVSAQVSISSLEQSLLQTLTTTCQSTLLNLATSSPLAQCLQITSLAPLLTSSSSVIPTIDSYIGKTCSAQPCSNTTLYAAAANLTAGCGSDLDNYGIGNETIYEIMGLYPLARELACLKTSKPSTSSNSTSTSSSTNSTSFTNGTFCITSDLQSLESYLGSTLTPQYILSAALGGNATTVSLVKNITSSPSLVCTDCTIAAIDLIEQAYPSLGNTSVSTNGTTLNQYFGNLCGSTGLNVSSNGTIPSTITESAVNSTFPYNINNGQVTYTAAKSAAALPTFNVTYSTLGTQIGTTLTAAATASSTANPAQLKKRWVGQI